MQHPRTQRIFALIAVLLVFATGLTAHAAGFGDDYPARIFIASRDGSREQQLTFNNGTNNPYGQTNPGFNKAGDEVLFEELVGEHASMRTVDVNTNNITDLTDGSQGFYFPTFGWGADEAIYATSGITYTLVKTDKFGANAQTVVNMAHAQNPAVSRDGTKVAFDVTTFDANNKPVYDVYTANSDGSNVKLVARGSNPTWSPDGTQLAIITRNGIEIVNASTGQYVSTPILSNGDYQVTDVTWSVMGMLAYESYYAGNQLPADRLAASEIWGYDIATRQGFRITTGSQPNWSWDGQKLTFTRISTATSAGPEISFDFNEVLSGTLQVEEGKQYNLMVRRSASPGSDLSQPSSAWIRFKSLSAHGSSTPNSEDFNSQPFKITWAAGQTEALATVTINQDTLDETTEIFSVYITDLVNGHLGDGYRAYMTLVINDDDLAAETLVNPPAHGTVRFLNPSETEFVAVGELGTQFTAEIYHDGQQVFSRTGYAIDKAPQAMKLAANQGMFCVWGEPTEGVGCPTMPAALQLVGPQNYTLTLTSNGQSVTASYTTNFPAVETGPGQYSAFLPLLVR